MAAQPEVESRGRSWVDVEGDQDGPARGREDQEVNILRVQMPASLSCFASRDDAQAFCRCRQCDVPESPYAPRIHSSVVSKGEGEFVVGDDPVGYRCAPANKSSAHMPVPRQPPTRKSLEVDPTLTKVLAKPATCNEQPKMRRSS